MEEFIRHITSQEFLYFDLKDLDVSYAELFPDEFFKSSVVMDASYADSFAKASSYSSAEEVDETETSFAIQPKILLMGHRRYDVTNSSCLTFQLYNVPGILQSFAPVLDEVNICETYPAVIVVIDAEDDYMDTLQKLQVIVTVVCRVNPNIKFNVFIHKIDNLSDADKTEVQRNIHLKICNDLLRAGLENNLSIYYTSIYDHSVPEALSRVVQKFNPYLPTLESLLNIFTSSSKIDKAFLFNVVSKIYIATDSSPVDQQSYKLCCDMIDVVFGVSCVYGEQDGPLFDTQSTSVIKLNNHVLYLRKVNRYIALICILKTDNFKKQGFIEYNFYHFQEAVLEVFKLWKKRKQVEITPDSMARHLNELSTKYSHVLKGYSYETIKSSISGNSTGMCLNSQQSSF
ncbi:hypothetical protein ACJMK2_024354 [Sinanodonta woodiana]|uniref:Uncharacterized protein n=1 Tax=Sinanodonta woodiana TaxID=1069815 RepID=A0ABD3T750_SINWO